MKIFIHIRLILVLLFTLNLQSTILNQQFSNLYAQDPQLFKNTWYLQKIVLENGSEHIPVPNEDVPYISLMFYDEIPYFFETAVCNYFAGEVIYQSNNNFLITHSESSLLLCEPQANFYFEGIQFVFFSEGGDHLEDPFPYNITTNGSEKTLVITNIRGDEAIYGDQILSIGAFMDIPFSVYPNPVKNTLTVVQNQNTSLSDVTVYVFDISGKLVPTEIKDVINSNISLNVSHLKSGIYFLNFTNKDGHKQIVRFIQQ
ncbi:MAG: hypothetical protein CVU03_00425 [Bacteroidetes bacterium HGW-Bacteroidetes-2]|jgi:hypothetical protein|nr:MAG: hypothetical protein CVU03_00425 [Bacteroidetes bacterium HGW-Bacteroidetes-2]